MIVTLLYVTVIVLLQLCRAIRKDTGEVKLSSSYDATRVWINHDCSEFDEFKQRLKNKISIIYLLIFPFFFFNFNLYFPVSQNRKEKPSVSSMSRLSGGSTFDDLTSNNITPTTII